MTALKLREAVLKSVKAIQLADFEIQQALIEFDLKTLSDLELEDLIDLADKSSQFRWEGLHKFSSEKYRRQAEDRERDKAIQAEIDAKYAAEGEVN